MKTKMNNGLLWTETGTAYLVCKILNFPQKPIPYYRLCFLLTKVKTTGKKRLKYSYIKTGKYKCNFSNSPVLSFDFPTCRRSRE